MYKKVACGPGHGFILIEIKLQTSGDGNKFIVGNMDDMIASERLGIGLIWIADQWSDATPSAEYVATTHLDVRVQIILDLVHDERDIVFVRRRGVRDLARRVCRAGHGVLLPRQEENHSAVASVRVE